MEIPADLRTIENVLLTTPHVFLCDNLGEIIRVVNARDAVGTAQLLLREGEQTEVRDVLVVGRLGTYRKNPDYHGDPPDGGIIVVHPNTMLRTEPLSTVEHTGNIINYRPLTAP